MIKSILFWLLSISIDSSYSFSDNEEKRWPGPRILTTHFVKDNNINKDAEIVTKQAKTIHINLPRDVSIEKIFTLLYSDSAVSCRINQFLVSQSSLEFVFIALGEWESLRIISLIIRNLNLDGYLCSQFLFNIHTVE